MPEKTSRKMQYLEECFETLACLGDGTDKEVFLVKRKGSGKMYVKKYVSPEAAEVCGRLEGVVNKNIARIHAVAQDGKKGLVIEEFINGVTLEEYRESRRVLTEEQVCSIVSDLCDALFEIHNRGIVHRDIKPENVMLSNDGVVKLIDFGIARSIKEGKRQDTEILGTAGYAAPEQFGYRQTDARADVYAVGVLMNKLLTGELPTQHLYDGPALQKVIRQCTEMDAKNRFQTIRELKNTVEELSVRKGRIQERQGGQFGYVREKRPEMRPQKDAAPQNGNRTKERRTPGFVIEGVPGFRTRDLEKNVAAAFGYIFLFFAPFASMGDYTSSIQIFLLALSARIIFLWVATLVLINFGDWDMKIFLTRKFSKKARKGIRITLWIIIAYAGAMLNNYVNYNLLGMIEP